MIEARIDGPGQPSDWDDRALLCGAAPLHSPAPHAIDRNEACHRFIHFVENGEMVGCSLAFDQGPFGLRRLMRSRRSLELPTAPAMMKPEREAEYTQALLQAAARAGYASLRIGASCSPKLSARGRVRRDPAIVEFTIDLQRDLESIRAGYHKQHRKNVRRAERHGLRVVEDGSLEGLLRLRAMQLSSSDRADRRAKGFNVPDEATFARLYELVYRPAYGRVLFAYDGDEAIAALAWLSRYRKVLTVRSGSLARGYESRAMYLLYDRLIEISVGEGIVELNAGGVPSEAADPSHAQAGLYEFKQGFGGVAHERSALEFDLADQDAH